MNWKGLLKSRRNYEYLLDEFKRNEFVIQKLPIGLIKILAGNPYMKGKTFNPRLNDKLLNFNRGKKLDLFPAEGGPPIGYIDIADNAENPIEPTVFVEIEFESGGDLAENSLNKLEELLEIINDDFSEEQERLQ